MKLVGAGLTDVGHVRHHNEDAFLCDVASGLFIVADGMGGKAAGETASKAVTTIFPLLFQEKCDAMNALPPEVVSSLLKEALCQLSQQLYQQSQHLPEIRGLGSTAAILFIDRNIAYIACAGDSRVYLLRDTRLIQVSEDQTLAAALVRTGHLSPETAESHPLRHALEEYIGKAGDLHPGIWWKTIRPGDRWLLCSDGLTKGVNDQLLRQVLLQNPSVEFVCHDLISTAKDGDGTDNITVIVVDIVEHRMVENSTMLE